MVFLDIETFNTDRAVLHSVCVYKLSKISGECYRDITQKEYEKCRKDCIVFRVANCIHEMLDHVLELKGEVKKLVANLLTTVYT